MSHLTRQQKQGKKVNPLVIWSFCSLVLDCGSLVLCRFCGSQPVLPILLFLWFSGSHNSLVLVVLQQAENHKHQRAMRTIKNQRTIDPKNNESKKREPENSIYRTLFFNFFLILFLLSGCGYYTGVDSPKSFNNFQIKMQRKFH